MNNDSDQLDMTSHLEDPLTIIHVLVQNNDSATKWRQESILQTLRMTLMMIPTPTTLTLFHLKHLCIRNHLLELLELTLDIVYPLQGEFTTSTTHELENQRENQVSLTTSNKILTTLNSTIPKEHPCLAPHWV